MLLNNNLLCTMDAVDCFACMTFCALRKSLDQCGSNGLPLTPNSVKILGRAQYLRSLSHPNLCSYVDVIRGKHERTVVVCEHVGEPLSGISNLSFDNILAITRDILCSLRYLHSLGLIHRNLHPDNILLKKGKVKLFNYGLYYMTGNGSDVMFPIGHPKYFAPEILMNGPSYKCSLKVDSWSVGVILIEMLLGCSIFCNMSAKACIKHITEVIENENSNLFMFIADEVGALDIYKALPMDAVELVNKMILVDPQQRFTASELLNLEIFNSYPTTIKESDSNCNEVFQFSKPMKHLYHYWQLAGGDVHSELYKEGLIRSKPPILLLPNLIILEGTFYGQKRDEAAMLDSRIVKLPLGNLLNRLSQLPYLCHFPLLEYINDILKNEDRCDSSLLPLVIRERDTEYQYRRVTLFSRLLKSYPYKKDLLVKESRQDIPPLVRPEVWASLLHVEANYEENYRLIDKESPMPTDRQIEVDIPRCHQYNELLSSNEGHRKFKRILKAWVVGHPQYVYWQGLDSLCAPFLFLNFYNEARAFGCLKKFIFKYLHDFFLKDNSAVIREYLAKFRHLIAFHDPELANHLGEIGFTPELFAIPWYLTMFSHVFPIHKILHLWDSLLIGNASYPLYVGLAILQQLRSTLLSSGFNECILLFSDLPEIDIEKVVKESINFYCSTPCSVTFRQHELPMSTILQPLNSELDMTGQPLAELQSEMSPRICARELIELLLNNNLKAKLILFDIRESNQFEKCFITNSINCPLSSLQMPSDDLNSVGNKKNKIQELACLKSAMGKIIVVISSDSKSACEFCNALVRLRFSKVCSLHGGFDVMRSTKFFHEVN